MHYIQYRYANKKYTAHILVTQVTKRKSSVKIIGRRTVFCHEYRDQKGIRYYEFYDDRKKIDSVQNCQIAKQFGLDIFPGYLKVVEYKTGYRSFGIHKDDLKLPEPLSSCINDHGTYDIIGPTDLGRSDDCMHRQCDGEFTDSFLALLISQNR